MNIDGLFRNIPNKAGKQGTRDNEGPTPGQTEEPGALRMILNSEKAVTRTNEIQTHKRTTRALCSADDQLTTEIIEVVAIVDTYLELYNRHHENESILIDWSVNSRYYQARTRKAISQAIGKGYLERYGKSITLSPRGEKVLRDYNRLFDEVEKLYRDQAEARKQKPKRKALNTRRPGEASRIRTRKAA